MWGPKSGPKHARQTIDLHPQPFIWFLLHPFIVWGRWCSPSTMWVPETELRSSGVTGSVFTLYPLGHLHSPAWHFLKSLSLILHPSLLEGSKLRTRHITFFKIIIISCVWVFCLRVHPFTTCEPGTQGGGEPPCGCWQLNPGPLQQQVLLTIEPTFQPHVPTFWS